MTKTSLKGLLAAAAFTVAGAAIAQSTPPNPAAKNPATGAGQQSSQATPMGTTGTPSNSGGATTGKSAGGSGSTAGSGTTGSGSGMGASNSGTSGGGSTASGSSAGTTTAMATDKPSRRSRADRN